MAYSFKKSANGQELEEKEEKAIDTLVNFG
jgi:hypothetical protein